MNAKPGAMLQIDQQRIAEHTLYQQNSPNN